jgi:hypothetical protein
VPNSKFGKFAYLIRNKLFNLFYNIYFFSISISTFEQTRFNIWKKKINTQFFITFFVEIGVRPDEWQRVGGEARSRSQPPRPGPAHPRRRRRPAASAARRADTPVATRGLEKEWRREIVLKG